ncbi:Retinoblastoma-like protein 1 [Armadillidium nasatum]|uniref:Retinoblastoma-like protein 1 n=1 Tax=Armadillidium nasatum TaxID=96803 RepID=A0A5N5SVL0_9CRUS|nr:Retinoblastoma-like protein 1 [Armadillidium nasatum]
MSEEVGVESGGGTDSESRKKYEDLCYDLNLDKATADEAWSSYEVIQQSYTLEGDQLPWLACALYTSCRKRLVPTVGGKPGNVIQGNCVSLTRMLHYCSLPLTDFILKMKAWIAMSHCDEDFFKRVDLLERNFAVCSNIFKAYKPIYLDLFQDPVNDAPRPPRSRKQRRPPWKYPSIPQDLVSCFSLLLACIDLIYTNVVLSTRTDLLNPTCEGLSNGVHNSENTEDLTSSTYPLSIMDYLCEKFDGVVVDTKVVREHYWKVNIKDLVSQGILKGTSEGTGLIEQSHFDHNVKEIKNAYEEYLLNCGEFDERMFLNNAMVIKGSSRISSPVRLQHQHQNSQTLVQTQTIGIGLASSSSFKSARCNLTQTFEGDHHLIPQTPITGRRYTTNRPYVGNTPLTVTTAGLQKLYTLIHGRKNSAGEKLLEIFRSLNNNPEEKIKILVREMSNNFSNLYSQATEDYTAPNSTFTKMRLDLGQILYYTFLEHILMDEKKREIDLEAVLKEELFHRTLFTCCLEIVLKSYNDARRFPWSLQVGDVDPYYFMRIIEPVIRSEKQSDNQLSRELVKHLKGIEEQILDSLAWRSESPLWQIIKNTGEGVPSCEDVNFSHQLETGIEILNQAPSLQCSSLMSPAVKITKDLSQSPVSSLNTRMESPNGQVNARRMLFPTASSTGPTKPSDALKRAIPPGLVFSSIPGSSPITSNNSQGSIGSPNNTSRQNTPAKENVENSSQSNCPTQITVTIGANSKKDSSNSKNKSEISKKDKPRRHGSLALFFRKYYTLANMRLRDLCDRLDITSHELRQKIWTCFEHSIIHYTELMNDRHMDQMIMCAIYITCKVTKNDKIFQEIMKHYRNQPQAASHVYRSVLISKTALTKAESTSATTPKKVIASGPPPTPSQVRGTSSTNTVSGERGDLIKFYNEIYVQKMRTFALKFRPTQEQEAPKLSPLPITRVTPISPRRRVSASHSVYVNSLNSHSPLPGATPMSPKRPLPYYFNRSPAKSGGKRLLLSEIDEEVRLPRIDDGFSSSGGGGVVRSRFQGVIGERQSPTTFENSGQVEPANLPSDSNGVKT